LRYIDRKDGTDLQLRQLDLNIDDFDLNRPFAVKLAAALYAEKQNVNVNARIGPLPGSGDWRDLPLDGVVDVDTLDLTRLKAAAPRLLSKTLELSGALRLNDLKVKGTPKDLAVNGEIEGTQSAVRYG